MTLEDLDGPVSSNAPGEIERAPAEPMPRRPPRPFVPRVERPMARTLEVLNDLANVLAAKGIEIRGAFAREGVVIGSSRDRAALKDCPREGEKFVGHFAIPTTDNRGIPFPSSMLLSILLDLYDLAGGASFRETVGLWEDEGVCYIDLLISIEVWSGDRAGLVTFIEKVCAMLRQKSIPLRIERTEFVWIGQASAVNS